MTGRSGGSGYATFSVPLTLGAANTWSIGQSGEVDHLVTGNVSEPAGNSYPLAVTFPGSGSTLTLSTANVGPVTASGAGQLAFSHLNDTSGSPVSATGGAMLTEPFDSGGIGPVTLTSSTLSVGDGRLTAPPGGTPKDGTLAVQGAASLDSGSSLIFYLDQAGTTPGNDFTQLTATGAVMLGGSALNLRAGSACTSLGYGDQETLISAPAGVNGTFGNAGNGAVLPVTCGSTTYQVRIGYTATTVTATVLEPTTTSLAASSTAPTAGSSVTFTAHVAPSGAIGTPTGTVQFRDGGTPISGCTAQPLSSSTATCTVQYPGAGSHSITASYGGDNVFLGSTSSALAVNVKAAPSSAGTPPPPGVTATTLAAGGVKTTRVTLRGTLTTGGRAVTWQFQYGRGRRYNKATPSRTIAAGRSGQIHVSWTLKRLPAHTKFHFRLVVFARTPGNVGQADGRSRMFTTRATGKLLMPARVLSIVGRTILVPEKCQSNVTCRGRFSITTTARVGKRHKLATVLCATATFRIRAHKRVVVHARITNGGLSLVRHTRHHRRAAKFTSRPRTGQMGLIKKTTLALR